MPLYGNSSKLFIQQRIDPAYERVIGDRKKLFIAEGYHHHRMADVLGYIVSGLEHRIEFDAYGGIGLFKTQQYIR